MSRTIATREYLQSKKFTEDRYGFYKGSFSLLKTTLNLKYEVWNNRKVIKQIPRIVEEIEDIYKECTSYVL